MLSNPLLIAYTGTLPGKESYYMIVKFYSGNTDTVQFQYSNVSNVSISKDGSIALTTDYSNPDGRATYTFDPSNNKITIERLGTEE